MFKHTKNLCFIVLITFQSYAQEFHTRVEHRQFKGRNDIKIVYTKYGSQTGHLGSVIISPGRTESSLKYEEVSIDLIREGFSPVFVINHRGQGLSERMLEDPHKGHVSKFENYYYDFNTFTKLAFKDESINRNNVYLLAHSMGGAIATGFLQNYGIKSFKGVILSSPMLGIKFKNKSETRVLMETLVACKTPFGPDCNDYADKKEYSEINDQFEGNSNTSSLERFERRKNQWQRYPQLQLGGPTIRWVRESIKANRKMRKTSKIRLIKKLPLLLLQAQNDITVNNSSQNTFCSTTNILGGNCTLEKIPNAKHEILMEADDIRRLGMNHIIEFMKMYN